MMKHSFRPTAAPWRTPRAASPAPALARRRSGAVQRRLAVLLRRERAGVGLLDRMAAAIADNADRPGGIADALRTLEAGLPADLACICRTDGAAPAWLVARPQPPDGGPAARLFVDIDLDLDMSAVTPPVRDPAAGARAPAPCPVRLEAAPELARRLAGLGFGSHALEPLVEAGRNAGWLLLARQPAGGFTADERRLLRPAAAQFALASGLAGAQAALAQARLDLQRNRQERRSGLDAAAHRIAHDISNAMSAAGLYSENLLAQETQLSERGRRRLDGIARAIEQAAAGLSRLRDPDRRGAAVRLDTEPSRARPKAPPPPWEDRS